MRTNAVIRELSLHKSAWDETQSKHGNRLRGLSDKARTSFETGDGKSDANYQCRSESLKR